MVAPIHLLHDNACAHLARDTAKIGENVQMLMLRRMVQLATTQARKEERKLKEQLLSLH